MENISQTIRDFSSHFVQELLDLFALPPPSHHRAAVPGAAIVWRQGLCPLKASHDTLACQFTNVPVGLSFHAHTCSV